MSEDNSRGFRLKKEKYYPPVQNRTVRDVILAGKSVQRIDDRYPDRLNRHWKDRRFLGSEFDKIERSRIIETAAWLKTFHKTPQNGNLPPVKYFCIHPSLKSSKSETLRSLGYKPIVLSALQKGSHNTVLGLLPLGRRLPAGYSLIQIESSKKKIITFDYKRGIIEPCLEIDEWNPLDYETIYQNLDYEKGITRKIILENMISEKRIADNFSGPIISAPNSMGKGGLALFTFGGQSGFAKELMITVEMITPPVFRTVKPPTLAEKGYIEDLSDGIGVRYADRPYTDNSKVDAVIHNKYSVISKKYSYREKSPINEYSVFSTLIDTSQDHLTSLHKIFSNFSDAEMIIPDDLDELTFSDIDLEKTQNAIFEDVHIEVIALHNHFPIFNESDEDFIARKEKEIKDHCSIQLEQSLQISDSDQIATTLAPMLSGIDGNLRRITQHFARRSEITMVDEDIISDASRFIRRNFEDLINQSDVKFILKESKQSALEDKKRWSKVEQLMEPKVRGFLIDNPNSNLYEIQDGIGYTSISEDESKLIMFLERLIELRYVTYNHVRGTYSWAL